MSVKLTQSHALFLTSIASACMLAACGGSDNNTPAATNYSGVVAATAFSPAADTTGDPVIKAGYYAGATVFVDANGNGVLDAGEPSTTTDANGHFTLSTSVQGQLVADISNPKGTKATNTASGQPVANHLILRASTDQIADQGAANVVISPMSSEVQRLVEANKSTYATEKANLATRLSGPGVAASEATVLATDVLADVNKLTGAEQSAVLYEDNALANRYTYATTKLDRGDMYPDNLAVTGGDPSLVNAVGVSAQTVVKPTETQAPITFAQSQQAAFNVEGIPRYDAIFVLMLENRSIGSVLNSSGAVSTIGIEGSGDAPYIAGNLDFNTGTWNQATTYYSTGNPSEPNYTALGGADDWGITDDNWWGCGVSASTLTDTAFSGGKAADGQPLVATPAVPANSNGDLSGYGGTSCAVGATAPHNINQPNLFTLLSGAGLAWRTYSESMNPGQDPRTDSVADAAVVAGYNGIAGTLATGTGVTSTPIAMPSALYKTKHHPGMAYQTARNLPEFMADNRTIFGTQYASALQSSTVYGAPPAGYNYDQFDTDLANGDVGAINFIMPDQCDDMHGTGNDPTCTGDDLVKRGDAYTQSVVQKIQASPIWKNPYRHVAIVVMFDEGEGSSTSCCGWNPVTSNDGQKALTSATGTNTATTQYYLGNHGHGNSIFGVITNHGVQGIQDSDAYSHFSFVRTLQDMFQLADPAPGQEYTYLSRAKYTESFIAANILNLPELAGSRDTHFDSVRPMNHAYITPANYTQKLNPADIVGTQEAGRQPGPDKTQTNIWTVTTQ